MTNLYFMPGCAFELYKPATSVKIMKYLAQRYPGIQRYDTCCRHGMTIPKGSTVIFVCSSCAMLCCGDSLYGKADDKAVLDHMKSRAESMPCEEVVTYCVSCTNGVYNGGRTPRLLTDLIFGEETAAPAGRMTHEKYMEQLRDYIKRH